MNAKLKKHVDRVAALELGSWGVEEDLLAAGAAGGMLGVYLGYKTGGLLGAVGGLVAGSLLAGTAALPISLAFRRSKTHTPSGAPL